MSRSTGLCRATRTILRAVRDVCAEHGVPPPVLRPGGKHLKLVLNINGVERVSPVACSPASAENAAREKVRDVMRLLREEGVIV